MSAFESQVENNIIGIMPREKTYHIINFENQSFKRKLTIPPPVKVANNIFFKVIHLVGRYASLQYPRCHFPIMCVSYPRSLRYSGNNLIFTLRPIIVEGNIIDMRNLACEWPMQCSHIAYVHAN